MTHLLYPTTNLAAIEQLAIVRGEGVYVFDNQGRRYLEGMAALYLVPYLRGRRDDAFEFYLRRGASPTVSEGVRPAE